MFVIAKICSSGAWSGASVHVREREPCLHGLSGRSSCDRHEILERVSAWGSVATFDLLRSNGAPTSWRSLHKAVEAATSRRPEEAGDDKRHGERMVRHLLDVAGLDVVGLDVNAPINQWVVRGCL